MYKRQANMFVRLDEKVKSKQDVLDLGIGNGDFIVLDPKTCLLYTSPSPRDRTRSRMPSSA